MLLLPRKSGVDSLFKEIRAFKGRREKRERGGERERERTKTKSGSEGSLLSDTTNGNRRKSAAFSETHRNEHKVYEDQFLCFQKEL